MRFRLRAERKCGQMLGEREMHGGDRRSRSAASTLKLADLNISRDQLPPDLIAARFPSVMRITHLTFDHHALVAPLSDEVAHRWPVSSREDTLTFNHHQIAAPLSDEAARFESVTRVTHLEFEHHVLAAAVRLGPSRWLLRCLVRPRAN